MVKSGRLLVIAAALSLGLQAGVATAQTVIARRVLAGSTLELVVNGIKVGTGTPDPVGDVRIPFDVQAQTGKPEMDATVHVDECSETLRRVLVADRNQAPPVPEAGCSRKDVIGVFWIKRVTTLVVDTGSPNATVFLRQGPVDLTAKPPSAKWDEVPTGLVVVRRRGPERVPRCLRPAVRRRVPLHRRRFTHHVPGRGHLVAEPVHRGRGGVRQATGRQRRRHRLELPFQQRAQLAHLRDQRQGWRPIGRTRLYGQGGATTTAPRDRHADLRRQHDQRRRGPRSGPRRHPDVGTEDRRLGLAGGRPGWRCG